MKKTITLLTSLCMTTFFITGCGTANQNASKLESKNTVAESTSNINSIFDGGSGSEEDPYQIASVDTLLKFADSVNDGSQNGYTGIHIQLMSDINLKDVKWTPIGNMNDKENKSTLFSGSFDGENHTISNLNYSSDEDFICGAGIFGVNCGEIKNLKVKDAIVKVKGKTSVAIAAVVGYNMGTVDNITLSGDSQISGNNCTGGIVGGNNSKVSNCTVENAVITVIGDNEFGDKIIQDDIAECGGLVIGGSFGGTIDNCTANGTIKAEGNEPVGLGGIGGCLEMMDSITNCTSNVTIESKKGGHAIGGLCGYAGTHSNPDICLETEGFSTKNYPCIIDNCKADVKIKADGATHVGGLVGTGLYYYGEETAFKITNSSVKGSIDKAVTPGTIAGRAEGSTIENCSADITIDGVQGIEQIGTTSCMYESADQ